MNTTHYQTPSNYQRKHNPEMSKKPSKTVPFESLSIAEMFERFSRNQPVLGTVKEPVYTENPSFDDQDFEKLANADMVEKEAYAERLADDMELIKTRDKAAADKAAKEAEDQEEQRYLKFKQRLAKEQSKDVPPTTIV